MITIIIEIIISISYKLKKNDMTKFKCPCKYTYDPEKGDPKQNIPPGTPFEELPEDFVCPVCGVGKDQFSEA